MSSGRRAVADAASGLSSAVAAAVEEAGPLLPFADAEQVELALGDRLPEAGLIREGNKVVRIDLARQAAVAQARQAGRPRGALNKRTADMRAYLLSRYAHPLEVLAQMISRPVDTLAAELECSKVEAATLVKSAAAELAPYIEGKMPVTVDVSLKGDMLLAIAGLTHTVEEVEAIAAGEFVEVSSDDDVVGDGVVDGDAAA